LLFAAAYFCVANIKEVPAADAGEVEDNPIAGLMGTVKTWTVGGATLRVVLEAATLCGREARGQ
jgi:hypothetical protein